MSVTMLLELIEEKERNIQDSRGDAQDRHYKDLETLNDRLELKMRERV